MQYCRGTTLTLRARLLRWGSISYHLISNTPIIYLANARYQPDTQNDKPLLAQHGSHLTRLPSPAGSLMGSLG